MVSVFIFSLSKWRQASPGTCVAKREGVAKKEGVAKREGVTKNEGVAKKEGVAKRKRRQKRSASPRKVTEENAQYMKRVQGKTALKKSSMA